MPIRAVLTAAVMTFALPGVRAVRPPGEYILVSLSRLGVVRNLQLQTCEPAQS
jgi:hypothetical protein